jgi:hypothetical protein
LSEEMKHKLKTEILPRIKETIEELRRRLKELGREMSWSMLIGKLRN